MLKLLIRKQLMEIFRGYFYDAKRNQARPAARRVLSFVLFAVVMIGVLGGTFGMLSFSMCEPLTAAGAGWLYFAITGLIALLLGVFGSVFNTYSGLYLAKDNDLLLSMPIPVGAVMGARLLGVFLMGVLYSFFVIVPAVVIYWIVASCSAAAVIGGIVLTLLIGVFALILSCVLGYVVARVSLKLKNRSFITVLLSVAFIAAYYLFYFRANILLRNLIANVSEYSARLKGSAYALYLFGRVGEGDWTAIAVFVAAAAILLAVVWFVLKRSFLGIATATGSVKKTVYRERTAKRRSVGAALLGRELRHLTGNSAYMLNCGLGVLVLPALGIFLLVRGGGILEALDGVFGAGTGVAPVLLCTLLCLVSSMVDTAAPSVSLEGRSLWIVQSLPLTAWQALRAKLHLQLLVGGVPMLFAVLCTVIVLVRSGVGAPVVLLSAVVPLLFLLFLSLWDLFFGVRLPVLNWTNEIYPIKQSASVMIALFGGWFFAAVLGVPYLLIGAMLGPVRYLALFAVLFAAASLLLGLWLRKKGAARFAAL